MINSIPMFVLTGIAVVVYSEFYAIPQIKKQLEEEEGISFDDIFKQKISYIQEYIF